MTTIFVFGASLAYLLISYDYGLRIDDEGYLLAGVTRLLSGQIPYIDFPQNYSPGRYYLFAALFRLFGEDLLVIRIFWVVLIASSAALAFLLARRLVPRYTALIAAVLVTVVPAPVHKSFFIFIPLLNLYLAALYLEERVSPFWLGCVSGVTILFRQDVGAVGMLVGLAAIFIDKMRSQYQSACNAGDKRRGRRRHTPFFLGILCSLLPLFLYYGIHSGIGELVSQLLFAGLKANKGKPLPYPNAIFLIRHIFTRPSLYFLIVFYAPLVLYALSLGLIIKKIAGKNVPTATSLHAMILLTGLLIFPQVLIRSDFSHISQVLPPFYLLITYWITHSANFAGNKSAGAATRLLSATLSTFLIAVVLYVAAFNIFLFQNQRSPFFTRFSREHDYRTLDIPRARVLLPHNMCEILSSVVRHVTIHTCAGDYLIAMPYAPIFNFLTDRPNPTRYDIFLPGEMDGSEEQQHEITRSMENPRLKYVIMDDQPQSGIDAQQIEQTIPEVYKYIAEHFVLEKEIGSYRILRRIDADTNCSGHQDRQTSRDESRAENE